MKLVHARAFVHTVNSGEGQAGCESKPECLVVHIWWWFKIGPKNSHPPRPGPCLHCEDNGEKYPRSERLRRR